MSQLKCGTLVVNLDSDLCGSDIAAALTPLCKCKVNYRIRNNNNNLRVQYTRYMVDAADVDKMEASRNELHSLLDKPQLSGIPVLVLGNKRDLPGALDETGLIERM